VAKIFFDTNLFIYIFEQHPLLEADVRRIRERMLLRGDALLTSAMTVGEILFKPVQDSRWDIERRYLEFFRSSSVDVVPFDLKAGPIYARIRQDQSVRPADAVQLACASAAGVDLFITNDERLSKTSVKGIQFITSLARCPL